MVYSFGVLSSDENIYHTAAVDKGRKRCSSHVRVVFADEAGEKRSWYGEVLAFYAILYDSEIIRVAEWDCFYPHSHSESQGGRSKAAKELQAKARKHETLNSQSVLVKRRKYDTIVLGVDSLLDRVMVGSLPGDLYAILPGCADDAMISLYQRPV
jgi:hypothetical protein